MDNLLMEFESASAMEDSDEYESEEENVVAAIISVPSSSVSRSHRRERQVSTTDSEDSFIVFDAGSDYENELSEETSSDEETESEVEENVEKDEIDFTLRAKAISTKKVRFAEASSLCRVYPMVQWSFAYQKARKGPWEEYARDRDRFQRRVGDVEKILLPIFDATHRGKVYGERFEVESPTNL